MKYYSLSYSTDEKEVGNVWPQCKGIPSGIGLTFKWFEQPNSMTKLTNDDFPNFEPELIFELEEKAILTDVVSPSNVSAKGFLINQKVKDIFGQFNLMEHKYYQATLIVKGNTLPYYWLHFKKQDDYFFNKIDFKKSSFYVGNLARWKQSELNIASTEDYYRIRKSIGFKTINFESLSISKVEEDLFYIDQMHNDFLISNELAKTLQALKISGLEVNEPKFLVNITL